jgi:hypothetical protein
MRKRARDSGPKPGVGKGTGGSFYPQHPPPGVLTMRMASSIHFSVSSADTTHERPAASVQAAFASILPRAARRLVSQAERKGDPADGTQKARAIVSGGNRTAGPAGAICGRTRTLRTCERRRRRRGRRNRGRSCLAAIHAPSRWGDSLCAKSRL